LGILTEKHRDVDEEEDEIGEVALAGEDAFWVGHAYYCFSFWRVCLDCRFDLLCCVELVVWFTLSGEFGRARAGIEGPIRAGPTYSDTSGSTYQDGGARP
jgi:hypothetical protein